jgi:hypothetical protein
MNIKNTVTNYIKNIHGWKTQRKIVCFAVDDYGNIRISSKENQGLLEEKGVQLTSRFDRFDAIDTLQDYELLFEALKSVKDKNGKTAVFTTYAMPSNVNFERSLEKREYISENLNQTYERLTQLSPQVFGGTYELLKKGISERLIRPQFHGREHLNITLFNRLISENNSELIANLELKCMSGIPNHKDLPNVRFSEAFSFWDDHEVELHKTIIEDGLNKFEEVYGYRPTTFTPPAMLIHPSLLGFVETLGIKGIDKPRAHRVHLSKGRYKSEKNYLGIRKGENHVTLVRNCMFEPNSRELDWVDFTYNQIKAAFFWGKPAIISSHRVNYCGLIDPNNRSKGLDKLVKLLNKIVDTWPDVEFLAVDELVEQMNTSN